MKLCQQLRRCDKHGWKLMSQGRLPRCQLLSTIQWKTIKWTKLTKMTQNYWHTKYFCVCVRGCLLWAKCVKTWENILDVGSNYSHQDPRCNRCKSIFPVASLEPLAGRKIKIFEATWHFLPVVFASTFDFWGKLFCADASQIGVILRRGEETMVRIPFVVSV